MIKKFMVSILLAIIVANIAQASIFFYRYNKVSDIVKQFNFELATIVSSRNCLPSEYVDTLESVLIDYEDTYNYIDFNTSITSGSTSPVKVKDYSNGDDLLGLENHAQQGTAIRVTTTAKLKAALLYTNARKITPIDISDELIVFGTVEYRDLEE